MQLIHMGIETGEAQIQHLAVDAACQTFGRDSPGPVARHHVRVRFKQDMRLWSGVTYRPQQRFVAADDRAAGEDRGIAIHLAHHQHQ